MGGFQYVPPPAGYSNVFPLRTPEWTDLFVPVNAVKVPAAQAPTWTAYKGTRVLAFSDQSVAGNEERVYFSIQLPHGYKEGSDISPHVHWVGENNAAENVVWQLSHSWANIHGVFPTETLLTVEAANSTTPDYHNMSEFPDIGGTGKTLSSMLLCELRRNSSNVLDTFAGKDAYLLEFDVHFQMDTLGSQQEFTK
jgi:hypothetical protein